MKRTAATILALLTISVTNAAAQLGPQTFETAFAVNKPAKVKGGRNYTPFYGYVISPHAIVEKGRVFCAFQNSVGQPIAMAYDIAKKRWAGPVKASEIGLGSDAHGNPSICIDAEGHLHLFYGCHCKEMRHTRSTKPYDITAWEEQKPPTPRATYPQTMRMPDGEILLFYRAGGHKEPWSLRTSTDNCKTWSEPEKVIEMRLDPPDRQAAAYCFFYPGSAHPGSKGKTIHCFWNHKDDNAARVRDDKPHPWRPLKYKGLHEAVYRYNVYYIRRDPDGTWRNAAGEKIQTPISKRTADTKCLVYDSGDVFTFIGSRMAVDNENRPYLQFGTGVVDWASVPPTKHVPVRKLNAEFVDGKWNVTEKTPDWPPEVERVISARGLAAYGKDSAGWFIAAKSSPLKEGTGGTVYLYHDKTGYATRDDGPAPTP